MPYKIKKSIQQYSLVDLLEILRDRGHPEYLQVKEEYDKRNPSEQQIESAVKELEIRLKSRNKPLSLGDKIYCFLIPLIYYFVPADKDSDEQIKDEFEKQIDDFEFFGETNRAQELRKWQKYAIRTYWVFLILLVLIGLFWLIFSGKGKKP
jgi:hypothetical protein